MGATLTWVADFPAEAAWQVWVRRYAGYGTVKVTIDEKPVEGGRGHPGGVRYVWEHLGQARIGKGKHHVDVSISRGMIDAALFACDAATSPASGSLPSPVKAPVLRDHRTYRDDSALAQKAGASGYVVGQVEPDEEFLYDWLPLPGQITETIRLWGAANQYVAGTFAVRAVQKIDEVRVTLGELSGPGQSTIGRESIDLRVVHVRGRRTDLFEQGVKLLVPELLLRDDRTALPPKGKQGGFGGAACVTRIPAHQSRQFWLSVQFPAKSPPGLYRGHLVLDVPGAPQRRTRVPVEVDLVPIDLQPAEGYYSIYYPSQSVDPKQPNYVPPARYLAELKDQARHGLNAVTLYGGFPTLRFAREAGMTRPPCVMNWPDSDAPQQVAEARKMGFEDLYYYGVDEPNQPDQIERCRKEAQRRVAAGLHTMTAVNSAKAQEATRDWIDRPVYNIYVFGGPDNAAAMYVRGKGFRPISYWTTATTWPLWFRALAGLYNKRCGYLGCAPWAYQDFPDSRLYDPDQVIHRVSYPDEFGEPIPTLCWEAHRAGIDDVRYLEAFDRAIAAGKKRFREPRVPDGLAAALERAQEVRRQAFDSISGRWFEYVCGLQPGKLDRARRELADATAALRQLLDQHR
jgi:hypothetical protein